MSLVEGPDATVSASISAVHIEGLFGLYEYRIPNTEQDLGENPILYGENGLGKTTILRILFHLLSPAERKNHRTSLSKISFRRVEVQLTNGIAVSATREGAELLGGMRLTVERMTPTSRELLGAWNWQPPDNRNVDAFQKRLPHMSLEQYRKLTAEKASGESDQTVMNFLYDFVRREVNPLEGESAFLKALKSFVPPIYFLTADRVLSSDKIDRTSTPIFLDTDSRPVTPETMVAKGREHALREAIQGLSRHLSQIAVRATRQGSRSTHSIYFDLIKRIAQRAGGRRPKITEKKLVSLSKRIVDLSDRYALYSRYGLAPQLQGKELVEFLSKVRQSERSIAVEVLTPYVESLAEQAQSVSSAYDVINTLVCTTNDFLFDKKMEFSLGEGITIRGKSESALEPDDLSSGEKQLLLLFSHVTMVHGSGGLFIIDEPEISLNIKWQRKLVDALMRLNGQRKLQFVMASHSIEILSRHRESVVALQETLHGGT